MITPSNYDEILRCPSCKSKISKFDNSEKYPGKYKNSLKIKNSILGSGGQLPSDLEALVISGVLIFPGLVKKHYEILESFNIENLRLVDIRDNVLAFVKKDYSELDIDLLKEFVQKNAVMTSLIFLKILSSKPIVLYKFLASC